MLPKAKGDPYFISCRKGAEEAAQELGVQLLWDGPTDLDPAKQNEVVESWITRRVDVIGVAVENAPGISTGLRKARERGIKVVTWDADSAADAREHYRRGTNAFNLGHYLEAVKEYEAAYQSKEDPALLFNIAQAYRLAGDYDNAIKFYRSFLRRVPKAKNRHEVDARIQEMTLQGLGPRRGGLVRSLVSGTGVALGMADHAGRGHRELLGRRLQLDRRAAVHALDEEPVGADARPAVAQRPRTRGIEVDRLVDDDGLGRTLHPGFHPIGAANIPLLDALEVRPKVVLGVGEQIGHLRALDRIAGGVGRADVQQPKIVQTSSWRISFSMSRSNDFSSASQKEIATPAAPARAVRPMRCT